MIGYLLLFFVGLVLLFCTYFLGVCWIAASQECILPGLEDIEV